MVLISDKKIVTWIRVTGRRDTRKNFSFPKSEQKVEKVFAMVCAADKKGIER